MKITKGTQLQFKAGFGRWREVTAREDFDTNEQYWKLTSKDEDTGKTADFNPNKDCCKLRILIKDKPKLIYHNGDIKDTEDEIKKVKNIVENLLETEERCRNDDKWLTFRVMQHFTKIFIPFKDFEKMPTFETIKRVRAKIQNVEKRFLPTNELIVRKRQQREESFREFARQ